MHTRGIHLQYSFEHQGQRGADIDNPLFNLLQAVQTHGSIRHAALALNLSYRHVWGALKHWETVLGQPLVAWIKGRHARLTPFAERLLWAERQARTRMTPHLEALRHDLESVLAQALDGEMEVLEAWASHDLALPALRDLALREQQLHLNLKLAGSLDALRALADGRCRVAGFHVPLDAPAGSLLARTLKPLLKPGQHKLLGCMRRDQGLMLAPALAGRVQGLEEATPLRWANRRTGSGTRLLMDHLAQAAGLAPATWPGYGDTGEDTHLAVAARIAAGQADVGPGIEAAARQFNLHFLPLVREHYFLVCLKPSLQEPAVKRLQAALASPAFTQGLAALPGYEPERAGEVLSLTEVLPWWRFKKP